MGFLKFFSRAKPTPGLIRVPSGSFTMDRQGKIITSTLPQAFPQALVREIGQQVLTCFRNAQTAELALTEVTIHYAALKLLARELRGGAIVFLMPQALNQPLKRPNHA
jgi:hypothetical protein